MGKKKYKDIEIGDKFGRLKVIEKGKQVGYKQYWIVQCNCDEHTIKEVCGTELNNGHTVSCGCKHKDDFNNWNKIKYETSFYDWCIKNNRQDLLNLWDYELNKNNPNEVGFSSHKKLYFKCSKGLHKSELYSLVSITLNNVNIMCRQCNSFAQYLIDTYGENALELYWDYDKNVGIDPWKIAHCCNKKVWIKCQEKNYHKNYEISCANFYKGKRCSYCAGKMVSKLDSLGTLYSQVLDIWSDKNKKSPYEYSPKSGIKVYWKCSDNIHEDYERKIQSSVVYNFRCPECMRERDESLLQEKVRKYLELLGKEIKHESNCTILPKNPRNKYNLPFDNEIVELNLIIETHGRQHYLLSAYSKHSYYKSKDLTPEQQLHKRKLYDRYKKYIAFCNGYFYLAIPYTADDKDETYKQLIDNKINEIRKILKAKSAA